ncbi:MAG TPA: SprB repeat-containing protein [Sedimentisphaerales bacterium]|nr:SprB repeat-containing protein [Sedimentisphaerales bacterium]
MKNLKWLFLGMMVMVLGIAGQGQGACSLSLNQSFGPSSVWLDGDTIEYVITLEVPAGACNMTDVNVVFYRPDDGGVSPSDICGSGGGTLVISGLTLTAGAGPTVIDSGDNAALQYVVNHADENPQGELFAYYCLRGTVQSAVPQNFEDEKPLPNLVIHPCIDVVKEAEPNAICEATATDIDYTYTVTNCGNVDLENINIEDDTCSGITGPTGDDGSDGILGQSETWTYTCTTSISDETTNRVDVNGTDVFLGTVVEANDVLTIIENPPPVVSVDPESAAICEGNSVEFCAVVANGGPYTYLWSTGETTECITVDEPNRYCVTVTDSSGCEDTNCADLTVNPTPSCDINAPASPPECDSNDNTLSANVTGGTGPFTYSWTSSDDVNWPITAGADTDTITYDAGPAGTGTTFTLEVIDAEGCMTSCPLFVTCGTPPGDMFCSFTQGFWGNAGGKFMGETTLQLLVRYFEEEDSLKIGGSTNSVTLYDANCVLERMPAGGKPSCLAGLENVDDDCTSGIPNALKKLLKKENKKGSRYNNVLMGQVIALTLNLWVDPDLADLPLAAIEGIFCTEGDDEDDVQCGYMPELEGVITVADLLALANEVLDCSSSVSVSDIYDAVTAINEGFDECRTIVQCREVCYDGIDNDCNESTPDCNGGGCPEACD